jgi:hypothetical protein
MCYSGTRRCFTISVFNASAAVFGRTGHEGAVASLGYFD